MTHSQTAFVETDTLRIRYERRGEGTPLLLLHGWPDSFRTWDNVMNVLTAGGYATFAPYLRGSG